MTNESAPIGCAQFEPSWLVDRAPPPVERGVLGSQSRDTGWRTSCGTSKRFFCCSKYFGMLFCELYYEPSTFSFCDQFAACNCGFQFWFTRHQPSVRPASAAMCHCNADGSSSRASSGEHTAHWKCAVQKARPGLAARSQRPARSSEQQQQQQNAVRASKVTRQRRPFASRTTTAARAYRATSKWFLTEVPSREPLRTARGARAQQHQSGSRAIQNTKESRASQRTTTADVRA